VSTPLFRGVGVALVTLFDEAGEVDTEATAALAAELVGEGVAGVVVAGSTGEAATLDGAERAQLTAAVRAVAPPDVPVLTGTGAPSARQAAGFTRAAVEAGADGVLVLSPPGSVDLEAYYRHVLAAADGTPVLGYHFPVMSAPGIAVEQLPRLGELGVLGLKDSSGDPQRMLRTLDCFDGDLYVGSSWLLSAAGPLGVTGAILAVANVEPALCVRAFSNGDVEAQRALTSANARATGPSGVKAMLAARGWSSRYRI
jgi:4-hydroxy-tetrahydrodipicolinate synthase